MVVNSSEPVFWPAVAAQGYVPLPPRSTPQLIGSGSRESLRRRSEIYFAQSPHGRSVTLKVKANGVRAERDVVADLHHATLPTLFSVSDAVYRAPDGERIPLLLLPREYLPKHLPFREVSLSRSDLLKNALALQEGLRFIHENGLGWVDISPNNALIDPSSIDPKWIDPELAQPFGKLPSGGTSGFGILEPVSVQTELFSFGRSIAWKAQQLGMQDLSPFPDLVDLINSFSTTIHTTHPLTLNHDDFERLLRTPFRRRITSLVATLAAVSVTGTGAFSYGRLMDVRSLAERSPSQAAERLLVAHSFHERDSLHDALLGQLVDMVGEGVYADNDDRGVICGFTWLGNAEIPLRQQITLPYGAATLSLLAQAAPHDIPSRRLLSMQGSLALDKLINGFKLGYRENLSAEPFLRAGIALEDERYLRAAESIATYLSSTKAAVLMNPRVAPKNTFIRPFERPGIALSPSYMTVGLIDATVAKSIAAGIEASRLRTGRADDTMERVLEDVWSKLSLLVHDKWVYREAWPGFSHVRRGSGPDAPLWVDFLRESKPVPFGNALLAHIALDCAQATRDEAYLRSARELILPLVDGSERPPTRESPLEMNAENCFTYAVARKLFRPETYATVEKNVVSALNLEEKAPSFFKPLYTRKSNGFVQVSIPGPYFNADATHLLRYCTLAETDQVVLHALSQLGGLHQLGRGVA